MSRHLGFRGLDLAAARHHTDALKTNTQVMRARSHYRRLLQTQVATCDQMGERSIEALHFVELVLFDDVVDLVGLPRVQNALLNPTGDQQGLPDGQFSASTRRRKTLDNDEVLPVHVGCGCRVVA